MIEYPPHPRLSVKEREENKESGDCLVSRLESTSNINGDVGALRGVHEHEIVIVIRAKEQSLPHGTFIRIRELRDAFLVPRAEDIGKRPIDGTEIGHQLGLLALG